MTRLRRWPHGVIKNVMQQLDDQGPELQRVLTDLVHGHQTPIGAYFFGYQRVSAMSRLPGVRGSAAFAYWSVELWIPWVESVHGERPDVEWASHSACLGAVVQALEDTERLMQGFNEFPRLLNITESQQNELGRFASQLAEAFRGSAELLGEEGKGVLGYAIIPEFVSDALREARKAVLPA